MLRYLKGTSNLGIVSEVTTIAYSDADGQEMSGIEYPHLDVSNAFTGGPVSWQSKMKSIALSTAEWSMWHS